tara:strand:+ start:172 stop:420 length:249 start_codon:yes stop_codon:yes gene_type:complete
MSHHAHGYRIYPDDNPAHSSERWAKATGWVNGFEFKRDYNEAMALAKLGVISFGIPFVVQMIPTGGKRPRYAETWVVVSKSK